MPSTPLSRKRPLKGLPTYGRINTFDRGSGHLVAGRLLHGDVWRLCGFSFGASVSSRIRMQRAARLRYLLDTNVCIRYLSGQSQAIKTRLERSDPLSVSLCSVVKAELLFGAAKSRASQQTRSRLARFLQPFESLPFDDRAANQYARIRAQLES